MKDDKQKIGQVVMAMRTSIEVMGKDTSIVSSAPGLIGILLVFDTVESAHEMANEGDEIGAITIGRERTD